MTLREAIRTLTEAGIEEAAAEARILFERLGGFSPAALYGADPLFPPERETALREALTRRAEREPLGYLLGEVPFYHSILRVSPACLIPRQDTEILVEAAIRHLPPNAFFADLCTGSGCIAVSVLAEREDCRAVGVDLSEKALAIAAENAARLGVSERLSLDAADLLTARPAGGPFDAILANPPYIETAVLDTLSPEVKREPREALDGGADGLLFYRRLLTFSDLLTSDGFFLFECGYDQEAPMRALSEAAGFSMTSLRDYGGNFRCSLLRRG